MQTLDAPVCPSGCCGGPLARPSSLTQQPLELAANCWSGSMTYVWDEWIDDHYGLALIAGSIASLAKRTIGGEASKILHRA
jgi:hypothetical protein